MIEAMTSIFSLYLDPTMTYSCAYFRNPDDSLEQAQHQKYEHIARKLLLKPGEKLLDIGCGWGGMLIHAVQSHGVTAPGNTISQSQYEHVRSKVKDLGLEDKIEVVCEDYRNLTGKYDKIVSIGMFEHVGREFIPVFMPKVDQLLNKGGLGDCCIASERDSLSQRSLDVKYIFPGNYLPTPDEIAPEMGMAGSPSSMWKPCVCISPALSDLWADNFEHNLPKCVRCSMTFSSACGG